MGRIIVYELLRKRGRKVIWNQEKGRNQGKISKHCVGKRVCVCVRNGRRDRMYVFLCGLVQLSAILLT